MSDDLAIYKSDWMRVLADVGLGASAISKAIELAELNGLFDPAKAALADVAATPQSAPAATIGDTPSEPRPPASAAMGHSAGADTAATPASPVAGRELVIASQQELFALREWKAAILGKCKASDGFDALEWGGDKEGWGFVHYFIGHLETRALHPEPAATPLRDALADMIDVYDGIATALDDSGRGWNGFRGAHLERIGTTVRKARALLRPEPVATAGWQPIETAPDNGDFILGYQEGRIQETVAWDRERKFWMNGYDDKPCHPTHWKPLDNGPVSRPEPAATPLPVRLPFDILNLVHDGIKNGKGSPEITDGIMGLINVALAAAATPAVSDEEGLIHGTYPHPVEHYERVARNLAAVWTNGNRAAEICILSALLKAASHSRPDQRVPE